MHTNNPTFYVAALSVVLSLSIGRGDARERQVAVPNPSPSVPSTQVLTVVNTIPDFLAFWTAAESKDEPTQVRMFRQMVMQGHPELFTENVVELGQKQGTEAEDRRIASYLAQVRPFIPVIRVLSTRLQSDLKSYMQEFTAVFPDYRPSTPVYFTVSLGSFDGGTRDVNGHTALLFGVDVIAGEYGADAKLSVLFDHELFHQYHGSLGLSQADDDGQLWDRLWEEGLATYVSWRMNPSANESDVLLNKTLAARARPLLPFLAAAMLHNLRSTDPKQYAKYFLGNASEKDTPARSGYFLGFLVASRIGQSSTPLALAQLSGAELRKQIELALKDLSVPASARNPQLPKKTNIP